MKILQVLLSPRVGGAETLADSLSAEWHDLGHASHTVFLDKAMHSGSRIRRVLALGREIKRIRPDVVVAHSAIPNVYARLAAPWRLPVVTVLHSASDDFRNRSLWRAELLLRFRTACVIAVSQQQLDAYLKRFGSGVTTALIPNGARITAIPTRGSSRGAMKVITLCRVAAQKNPLLWIEAVRRVSLEYVEPTFDWWGPAEPGSSWEQVVERHNAANMPGYFAGATPHAQTVLGEADILFHPSDSEAHSLSIIEAASAGIPIVCSSAVAATLNHPTSVEVFEVGDPIDAARALTKVISNWSDYKDTAMRLAPDIRKAFDMRECAKSYLRLFESLC